MKIIDENGNPITLAPITTQVKHVASTIASGAKNGVIKLKHVSVSEGIGSSAKRVSNLFTGFGRGLKRGWEKA